jgi:hypothetical protein
MEYIIEHALPPASLAAPLGQSLKQSRPDLSKRLSDLIASQSQFEPQIVGCTPFEARVLTLNGWSQSVSQIPGQALAAWQLAVTQSTAPVWAAQLCSTQIGTSAASLRPLSTLELSHDEAQSLCEAAQPSFGHKDDAIWVEAVTASTWRVHAPLAELAHTVSPEALAGQNIAGWWPDSDAWLAWRRILNEIQMVWHNHPVNEARLERGLPAINGVWLFGGAPGWQPLLQPQPYQLISTLRPFVMSSDWSGWLESWLKNVLPLLTEMQKGSINASTPTRLTLTGQDRLVTLTHFNQNQPNWLKKLARPFTKNDWSTWWHNPL